MYNTKDDSWDPHHQLEFAKVCLRTVVEKAQADRKKKEKSEEEGVNESLNKLITRLGNLDEHELEEKEEIMIIIE